MDISFVGGSMCHFVVRSDYSSTFSEILTTEIPDALEVHDYNPADFTFAEMTLHHKNTKRQKTDIVTRRFTALSAKTDNIQLQEHYSKELNKSYEYLNLSTTERKDVHQRISINMPPSAIRVNSQKRTVASFSATDVSPPPKKVFTTMKRPRLSQETQGLQATSEPILSGVPQPNVTVAESKVSSALEHVPITSHVCSTLSAAPCSQSGSIDPSNNATH